MTGARKKSLRLAVDIGGTFTDLVAFDEAGQYLLSGKVLSTHDALVDGIRSAMQATGIVFADAHLFLHGTTVGINTLLERTGAQAALITNKGFRDVYEIGRINRPDAYNLFFTKHEPLIARSWRVEVDQRTMADGAERTALDEGQVREVARALKARGVEAVAVMLLHSYRSPDSERRIKAILAEEIPGAFITASHELTQEYREFERVSTVAANAYIGPQVSAYLDGLGSALSSEGFSGDFYIVQSSGGLFPMTEAREQCIRMLESGPAAGVVGTQALCRQLNMPDAIAFDMGGTTAKAGVISDYRPLTSSHALIGPYDRALPIQIPMIDIFEVGTGGGSIAQIFPGNALRVGPKSAGSMPGPACYGCGGALPTVTDANLILGILDADHFLGGEMRLDLAAARSAMEIGVARQLGLSVEDAAAGILKIATTAMSHAIKGVTTERGLDPGAFSLVVYGGAGPLHASMIARELGIKRVLIPYSPGHFSAYGMLFSDLRYDYVQSCFQKLESADFDLVENLYKSMERRGLEAIGGGARKPADVTVIRYADMRYVGQEHAVTVELPIALLQDADRLGIKARFDAEHLRRYGTSAPAEQAEIVSVRLTALGHMQRPAVHDLPQGSAAPAAGALHRYKNVFFPESGYAQTPVYTRAGLAPDNTFMGPALVEEHASTTVVQPGDVLRVDRLGNLEITIGSYQ